MISEHKSPLISVITAVWNNKSGLEFTAPSVCRQTWTNIEHVIIDGDSSDGTQEWISTYSPNFAVQTISEPDDGIYDAMNKGASLATGDILIFLNGGDRFVSDNILELVATEWLLSDWSWSIGGINYIDNDEQTIGKFAHWPFQPRKVELGLTYYPHPAAFFSRKFFERLGGYRDGFGWSADQELMVRAARQERPYIWQNSLTDFAVGGAHSQGSLMGVAKRYHKIREANDLFLFRSQTVDRLFTILIGGAWTLKGALRDRLGRGGSGVDTKRIEQGTDD